MARGKRRRVRVALILAALAGVALAVSRHAFGWADPLAFLAGCALAALIGGLVVPWIFLAADQQEGEPDAR